MLLANAQRMLDADRPFQAHEILEAGWKSAPENERPLWRALAQLAVGLTHARRGNQPGAQALFSPGAARVRSLGSAGRPRTTSTWTGLAAAARQMAETQQCRRLC